MKVKLLLLVLSIFLLAGCANTKFQMKGAYQAESVPTYEEDQMYFASGFGQKKNIDAARVCGSSSKVARVEVELTPINVILSFLTSGIYTPIQASVYCVR